MIKKIAKYILTAIAVIVLGGLGFIFYKYNKLLSFQRKFGSEMNYARDSIFRETIQNNWAPESFNQQTRLFYLCKVWGFLKYYRQDQSTIINVDSILLATIPKIQVATKNECRSILKSIIETFDYKSLKPINPYLDIRDYTLICNQWMSDTVCLDSIITKKLQDIFASHVGMDNHFVFNRMNEGTVRLKNENEYLKFDEMEMRLLGLFRYWNIINYFYPSKNHIGNNWDSILYTNIPRFQEVESEKEYRLAIYKLTNSLNDSHSSYPPSIDGAVFGGNRPNFRMKRIAGKFIINEIRFDDFNTEGFQVGDIILEVNGAKVTTLFDSLQQYTGGGNVWSSQRFVCNAILSTHKKSTVFKLCRGDDTLSVTSINRPAWDLHQKKIAKGKEEENDRLFRWLSDSIAYLKLENVTSSNFQDNYAPIVKAPAIILDLRCYPDTRIIEPLADNFVPPNTLFAIVTYADARFPGMLRHHPSSNLVGSENYYRGKVIVLVDELTESYSEYVTMLLQQNPNTITVGNSSSGADGNISQLEFPGGVKTIYSGIGILYPDMSPTQRVGVRIDYVVEPTIESIQSKKDLTLEKAIQVAISLLNDDGRK